jgi:hypothetical protein
LIEKSTTYAKWKTSTGMPERHFITSKVKHRCPADGSGSYGKQEFIIELKIWRGEEYRKSGYRQLADYLNSRRAKEGYLLTFDFRKESNKTPGEEWINIDELRVFDVMLLGGNCIL